MTLLKEVLNTPGIWLMIILAGLLVSFISAWILNPFMKDKLSCYLSKPDIGSRVWVICYFCKLRDECFKK